jgi:hypothetical protein
LRIDIGLLSTQRNISNGFVRHFPEEPAAGLAGERTVDGTPSTRWGVVLFASRSN